MSLGPIQTVHVELHCTLTQSFRVPCDSISVQVVSEVMQVILTHSDCRVSGQQSVSCHDEGEEAILKRLLAESAHITAGSPDASSAAADGSEQASTSSGPTTSDKTALGVVGMLRRLRIWTEEDATNGKLTLLSKNIQQWLRRTQRSALNLVLHFIVVACQCQARCHDCPCKISPTRMSCMACGVYGTTKYTCVLQQCPHDLCPSTQSLSISSAYFHSSDQKSSAPRAY